jgi:CHC2-type zinc finger protein
MHKSDRIKAEMSLRQAAEFAGVSWDLKKSNIRKGDWWGPCPLHAEETASFHVVEPADTGGVFKCFGCQAGGSIIDFTMAHLGVDFVSAVRRLTLDGGLESEISPERKAKLERDRKRARARAEKEAERKAANGHRIARHLWHQARPEGAVVAQYLAARGVRLAAIGGVPATLRGIAGLDHFEGSEVTHWGPVMIGAIGRDRLLGAHRTWITPEGRATHQGGRKVVKQWIGRTGELMGRPVVLSPPTSAVVVGEGIETTLTAFSGLIADGRIGWSAEAALSRGAITGPTSDPGQLWTPRPGVAEVMILGEGSSKDPRTAESLYRGAAARLTDLGLKVHLTVPFGRWDLDADFADLAADEFLKG